MVVWRNEPQKELIAKHIGSSRFVYNLALETKNAAYLGSKHKNILSGTDRKNQGKLPTLVGALTLEAQPISFAVGG